MKRLATIREVDIAGREVLGIPEEKKENRILRMSVVLNIGKKVQRMQIAEGSEGSFSIW